RAPGVAAARGDLPQRVSRGKPPDARSRARRRVDRLGRRGTGLAGVGLAVRARQPVAASGVARFMAGTRPHRRAGRTPDGWPLGAGGPALHCHVVPGCGQRLEPRAARAGTGARARNDHGASPVCDGRSHGARATGDRGARAGAAGGARAGPAQVRARRMATGAVGPATNSAAHLGAVVPRLQCNPSPTARPATRRLECGLLSGTAALEGSLNFRSFLPIARSATMIASDSAFSRKSLVSFGVAALLAVTAATAQFATGTTGIDASGNYQQEVQACLSGRSQEDQATCLREAR